MKYTKQIIVILFFTFLLVIPMTIATAQGTGEYSGIVTEHAKPIVLEGVLVEIGSLNDTTDINGEWRITNIPQGTYTLKMSKEGYQKYSDQITVYAGGSRWRSVTLKPIPTSPIPEIGDYSDIAVIVIIFTIAFTIALFVRQLKPYRMYSIALLLVILAGYLLYKGVI